VRKKLTYEEFVNKANKIFDVGFNYSKFVYVNNKTKGIICCPLHGDFLQTPKNHLIGQGCACCSNNKKIDTNTFIVKANYIHQNKYNYSKSLYINNATKLEIECPMHGLFKQRPNNHLAGQGCPKCKESKGERLIRSWLVKNKIEFNSKFTLFEYKNEKSLLFDFAIFDKKRLVGLIEYDGVENNKIIPEKTRCRDQIKIEYCKMHNIPLLVVSYEEMTQLNKFLKEFVSKRT
jgi:hypothetical protein